MSNRDLGLKCGIEIHQQLEGKKLFCNCPTKLRDEDPSFRITRKLRASAGESGEIDIAAKHEQKKNKKYVYEGYHDTTCLVEVDEEPPREISTEALYTVLQFSKLVKANISPIVQVMRKTVVDGSNTSGFQRTALVARNGKIETSEGEVRIANINIEEDACRIIAELETEKIYRLDRLGIPLIEIGTEPDIKSPQQCQEVAKKLGLLLRSLPGVKRGLGTIRQDINVSIEGGVRIEIKGAQDLKILPQLVELEGKRQSELLKIKSQLKEKLIKLQIVDVSSIFQESNSKIIRKTLDDKGKILGMKLNNFAGLVGRELQPGYRLGTEFSGRAKIKAEVGGIFHSDEMPNYGITEDDVRKIIKKLKCDKDDAFILVADEENKAKRALEAVYERVSELYQGIPKEVRKANVNGTTSFLRPMPGAARMYPETDVPLIEPTVKIELPEILEDKIKRFQEEYNLSYDLAVLTAKSDKVELFEELIAKFPNQKQAFIAETLISTPLEIKRKYQLDQNKLNDDDFRNLFYYLDRNKIHKDIILDVLIDMIKGTFKIEYYFTLGTEEIHKKLQEIINQNREAPFPALMGIAMKELAGKASGKFISDELKKMMKG